MSSDKNAEGEEKTVVITEEKSPTLKETETPKQESDLSKNEGEFDYKAAFEAEVVARQKAETKLVKTKRKLKAIPKVDASEEFEDDENEDDDMDTRVERAVKKQSDKMLADTIIAQYTKNPDKQRLVKLHLDTIRSSGDIATDVRRALLIADESIFSKMSEEQKATALSSMGTSTYSAVGTETPTSKAPDVSMARSKQVAINNLPPRYKNLYKK